MKTLYHFLILTILLHLICDIQLSAQVPQKFNYQAVVRNTDGSILPDQSIGLRISIVKDSPGGTSVYRETHSGTTSALGLINLEIGNGTSVDNFSGIDWKTGSFFLKIEIDPSGGSAYTPMGTSQLLSVPYALYADDSDPQELIIDGDNLLITGGNSVKLPADMAVSPWTNINDTIVYRVTGNIGVGTSSPSGKLEVQGDGDETDEDALFEVKRKDGQSVFAVYPTGVQVFVEDLPGKGSRGGFAIGGFGSAKGITNEYMRVTPDSVRIYIDEAASKGSRGGFAIGGMGNAKGGRNSFMQITPENYFIGQESGSSITDGLFNSFMGYQSGTSTTAGDGNIFLGYKSGFSNETGERNTFMGNTAGFMNTDGFANVFIGDSCGFNSNSNWNIFIGNNAGFSNTEGVSNVAIGDMAGYSNMSGNWNVFIGDLAGYSNTIGTSNVFIGVDAGLSNDDGSYNVFLGESAGFSNISGSNNVFLGESSGLSNEIGESNVFIGTEAGSSNTDGSNNVFMGDVAGYWNTIGEDNIFMGSGAGEFNEEGNYNVFIGTRSGNNNTFGDYNVFLGDESGYSNDLGISNVFLGLNSGYSNTDGNYNVFLGTLSGTSNLLGEQNVYLGQEAGYSNQNGNYNVSIGSFSGYSNIDSNNTFLGYASGYLNVNGSNNIFIGNGAGYHGTGWGGKTSNMFIVDNDYNTYDQSFIYGEIDGFYLYFNALVEVEGDLYCNALWETSDKKFKKSIQPYQNTLAIVKQMNAVTYEWDTDILKGDNIPKGKQIGLIAQDVEALIPELVQTDRKGDKAVNYTKLTAVLIEAMKEQQKMIEELQVEVSELKAALAE